MINLTKEQAKEIMCLLYVFEVISTDKKNKSLANKNYKLLEEKIE